MLRCPLTIYAKSSSVNIKHKNILAKTAGSHSKELVEECHLYFSWPPSPVWNRHRVSHVQVKQPVNFFSITWFEVYIHNKQF